MENSPIFHEWFWPEGPGTYEYPLPVDNFSDEHKLILPEWIRDYSLLNRPESQKRFIGFLTSISTREIRPFLDVVETLAPYSVVINESKSWLLCKKPEEFLETSCNGNMLQLPAPHEDIEWPPFFESDVFDPLKHFLKYFGGTRLDMPPTCGILAPKNLKPAIEDLEDCAWKNIGAWNGSYPVYDIGNGDAILVRADGQFGVWCHEHCNEDFVAVSEIGLFKEFIEFVAKASGITF